MLAITIVMMVAIHSLSLSVCYLFNRRPLRLYIGLAEKRRAQGTRELGSKSSRLQRRDRTSAANRIQLRLPLLEERVEPPRQLFTLADQLMDRQHALFQLGYERVVRGAHSANVPEEQGIASWEHLYSHSRVTHTHTKRGTAITIKRSKQRLGRQGLQSTACLPHSLSLSISMNVGYRPRWMSLTVITATPICLFAIRVVHFPYLFGFARRCVWPAAAARSTLHTRLLAPLEHPRLGPRQAPWSRPCFGRTTAAAAADVT